MIVTTNRVIITTSSTNPNTVAMATAAELVATALEAGSDIMGMEGPSLVYEMVAEAGDGIMDMEDLSFNMAAEAGDGILETAEEYVGDTMCKDEMLMDDTAVVDPVLSGSTK